MKALFHRKVKVEEFTIFAKLEILETREDIQEFLENLLEGNNLPEQRIQERICQYLQKIGLLNRDNTLSPQGEDVIETALVPQPEEGKYKIWCALTDKLLDKRVLAIKREKPQRISHNRLIPLGLEDLERNEYFAMVIHEKDRYKTSSAECYLYFQKIGSEKGAGMSSSSPFKVDLRWNWNNSENSQIQIEGNIHLQRNYYLNIEEELEIDRNSLMDELADENGYQWNWQNQRLMISNDKCEDSTYQSFLFSTEMSTRHFSYGEFQEAHFQEIPVMPKDLNSAKDWRYQRIEKWLEEKYVNEQEFKDRIQEENQHPAFVPYNMGGIKTEKFLGQLSSTGKTEKSTSFWHLAAAFDLDPKNKVS